MPNEWYAQNDTGWNDTSQIDNWCLIVVWEDKSTLPWVTGHAEPWVNRIPHVYCEHSALRARRTNRRSLIARGIGSELLCKDPRRWGADHIMSISKYYTFMCIYMYMHIMYICICIIYYIYKYITRVRERIYDRSIITYGSNISPLSSVNGHPMWLH